VRPPRHRPRPRRLLTSRRPQSLYGRARGTLPNGAVQSRPGMGPGRLEPKTRAGGAAPLRLHNRQTTSSRRPHPRNAADSSRVTPQTPRDRQPGRATQDEPRPRKRPDRVHVEDRLDPRLVGTPPRADTTHRARSGPFAELGLHLCVVVYKHTRLRARSRPPGGGLLTRSWPQAADHGALDTGAFGAAGPPPPRLNTSAGDRRQRKRKRSRASRDQLSPPIMTSRRDRASR
jgi:hypothetical protein